MSDIISNIKNFYKLLVPGIDDDSWENIAQRLSFRTLPKGSYYIRAGEICRYVSFINQGLLRFYYMKDGKEVITGFMEKQQYISDYSSFLLQQPSTKYIEVLEDASLAELSYQDVQELYCTSQNFERFGRRIAEQLFLQFDMQQSNLVNLKPEQRYLLLIEKQSTLLQRIPQYMLASYLGVTPEHLSRIRAKLSRSS